MIHPDFKPCQCLLTNEGDKGSATMLATKRLAGVRPEVNLMECVTHTPILALKPTGDVTQNPKEGIYTKMYKKE